MSDKKIPEGTSTGTALEENGENESKHPIESTGKKTILSQEEIDSLLAEVPPTTGPETKERSSETIGEDIKTAAKNDVDQLEQGFPQEIRKEPEAQQILDEAETNKSDLDAQIEAIIAQYSDTAESAPETPEQTQEKNIQEIIAKQPVEIRQILGNLPPEKRRVIASDKYLLSNVDNPSIWSNLNQFERDVVLTGGDDLLNEFRGYIKPIDAELPPDTSEKAEPAVNPVLEPTPEESVKQTPIQPEQTTETLTQSQQTDNETGSAATQQAAYESLDRDIAAAQLKLEAAIKSGRRFSPIALEERLNKLRSIKNAYDHGDFEPLKQYYNPPKEQTLTTPESNPTPASEIPTEQAVGPTTPSTETEATTKKEVAERTVDEIIDGMPEKIRDILKQLNPSDRQMVIADSYLLYKDGKNEPVWKDYEDFLHETWATGRANMIAPLISPEDLTKFEEFQKGYEQKTGESVPETPTPETTTEVPPPVSTETATEQPTTETTTETKETEPAAVPTLEQLRSQYAKNVTGRKKVLGRTSQTSVEESRQAYEGALKGKFQEQLQKEFAGMDLQNEQVLEQYLAKQAELITANMQERELLVDAMNGDQEKTTSKKFKDFWKRHAKLRLAIGAGLTAGAFVGGATGNIPVMSIFLGARMAMSGAGTTMAAEAGWESLRQKFGKTGKMSKEKIQKMDDGQLEEYYAAQSVGSADRGLKRGKYVTFFGRTKDQATAKLVATELESRRQEALKTEVQQLKEQGKSNEEIMTSAISSLLKNEEEGHKQLESRTDWLRKNNVKKWVFSLTAGAAMSTFIGVRGIGQIREALGAKEAAKAAAQKTAETQPETPPFNPDMPAEPKIPAGEVPADASKVGGVPEKPFGPGVTETTASAAKEAAAKASDVVTAQKGDSVWKIIEQKLHEKLGTNFDTLPKGQQTHLIDQMKDKIVANPDKFGLKNPEMITPGQKVDLTSLFHDDNAVKSMYETSKNLSAELTQNIEHNNEVLSHFAATHPDLHLTPDVVDQVLSGEFAKEAAKAAGQPIAESYSNLDKLNPDWANLKMPSSENITTAAGKTTKGVLSPDAIPPEEAAKIAKATAKGSAAQTVEGVSQTGKLSIPSELGKLRESIASDSGEVITLEHGAKTLEKIGKITDPLPPSTINRITEIKVGDFVKGSSVGRIDTMEGVSTKTAKELTKHLKEMIRLADTAHGTKVNREWTLGTLSKAIKIAEKAK